MRKKAEAFRSIGEVAELIGVAPHVLRYWETQFTHLRPMKRPDGRRYYRQEDIFLAAGLYEILRDDGLTIRGACKVLARDRGESVREKGAKRLAGQLKADTPPSATVAPAPIAKPEKPEDQPALPLFASPAPLPLPDDPLSRIAALTLSLQKLPALSAQARPRALRLRDALARRLHGFA